MIVPALKFILFCALGSVLGLFVGAVPGLSVTMATALLASLTYTWQVNDALATVMGIYVVGVFAGALSAILLNIPGAPSSVATTIDGYPLARRGEAKRAFVYATVYSFTGGIFGLAVLALFARPVAAVSLLFWPMDYFLLALFGLVTICFLGNDSAGKGIAAACAGLVFACTGMDPVRGTPRLTLGLEALNTGVPVVPALIGLFGFAEVLSGLSDVRSGNGNPAQSIRTEEAETDAQKTKPAEVLRRLPQSLLYCITGTLIGALPGAGTPVASLTAYAQAKRIIRHTSRPFGEGAVEGIVASESANNACIGGALIPMLALGIPGDAVTAIILSVFRIHGLQPGPLFFANGQESFQVILLAGGISCFFLLLLGLFAAPHLAGVMRIPKAILTLLIALACVFGAYAVDRRPFDVLVMLVFGLLGFLMRRCAFPVAPLTLALVLGRMMESNLRRAFSLASSADNFLSSLFGRPLTLALLLLPVLTVAYRFARKRTSPLI